MFLMSIPIKATIVFVDYGLCKHTLQSADIPQRNATTDDGLYFLGLVLVTYTDNAIPKLTVICYSYRLYSYITVKLFKLEMTKKVHYVCLCVINMS